jgi:dihydropteroate synthase
MGVVNVTPDSFSDGGRFLDPARAIAQAQQLETEGADLIDLGAESTRPGAREVPPRVEWSRIGPVLKALHDESHIPLSVDTRHVDVARRALEEGADLINDVGGLGQAPMRRLIARTGAPAVVMHMRGTPATMQEEAQYHDLRQEVYEELASRVDQAIHDGVPSSQLLIDPGLGFSKTPPQSLELLKHVGEFRSMGYPVVVGTSRKSFLGWALGGLPLEARAEAGLAAAIVAASKGIEVLRVHEVQSTIRALRFVDALRRGGPPTAGRSLWPQAPAGGPDRGSSTSKTREPR